MRHRLLATAALGSILALSPVAAATDAFADQATVTPDQCYAAGGFFGGYDSTGHAFCTRGTYDGVRFDKDPLQGWCPDGSHLSFVYLTGLVCVRNVA